MRYALVLPILLVACGGGNKPAASVTPSSVDEQVEAGRVTYAAQCASCHGEGGAGGDKGPALIGPAALEGFKNARIVFTYIHDNMPPDAPRSLGDAAYWNVTAFLIKKNDLPLGSVLTADNAAAVQIPR